MLHELHCYPPDSMLALCCSAQNACRHDFSLASCVLYEPSRHDFALTLCLKCGYGCRSVWAASFMLLAWSHPGVDVTGAPVH